MPTLLPARPAIVAEHVHIPTVIASLLAVALLTMMTVLTRDEIPLDVRQPRHDDVRPAGSDRPRA